MEKEPLEALKVFSISPSDLHKFGAYNIKPEFVLMNSNFSYQMCRKYVINHNCSNNSFCHKRKGHKK